MVDSFSTVKKVSQTWLLPTAAVGYVALLAARSRGDAWGLSALVLPLLVAWSLRALGRRAQGAHLATDIAGLRWGIIGTGLFLATLTGPHTNTALRGASAISQGFLVGGALLSIARLASPPGILQGHPQARSLDALALTTIIWATTASAALLRAFAPSRFPLDPIQLDYAFVFGDLGSMLLLCASLLRTRWLRGLQLGVGDRVQAALSLAVAGTIVGAGSGFVQLGTSDRVAASALVGTCIAVMAALAVPQAALVTRAVRGLVALLIIGTPLALASAWLATQIPTRASALVLVTAVMSMAVGLLARRLATPLAPEGSRWLHALQKAIPAALHPEPEQALRAALTELRLSEPKSKSRPEIFRIDPPGMLSVDIAGYLSDEPREFPEGVLQAAMGEPSRTLRLETILAAQIRQPSVRPLADWFQAHDVKTATALMDESGPIGLFTLPRGSRKSSVTMEEAALLHTLAERLGGLISVTGSLRRSREREVGYQRRAETADKKANLLVDQLQRQEQSDHLEAEARVEILRAAAHSPGAQIVRLELEKYSKGPTLCLEPPLGVDSIPWAAHAHLIRDSAPRPLIIVDLSERVYRTQSPWKIEDESAPWNRAKGGTLVLLHPSALPESSQLALSEALEVKMPSFVITCQAKKDPLIPRLQRKLNGPSVALPSLAERAEDLQALIINELTQLGLTHRGAPLGIDRGALFRLIDRPYPGNDAELKGILASAAGHATSECISTADIDAVVGVTPAESPLLPRYDIPKRRRGKPPRARRR